MNPRKPYTGSARALRHEVVQHELWLNTDGVEGTRADFSNQDLTGADLAEYNLRLANFTNAILVDTAFTESDLRGCNFSNASLKDAYTGGALMDDEIDTSKDSCMFDKVINKLLKLRFEFHVYNMNAMLDGTDFSNLLPDRVKLGDDFRFLSLEFDRLSYVIYDTDINSLAMLYNKLLEW